MKKEYDIDKLNPKPNPYTSALEFRTIRPDEASEAADIEEICFPPNEACSREHMKQRIAIAPDYFLVAVDTDRSVIAGFLNGIATNEKQFRDEFFTDATLHDPSGSSVMLLGLDVRPEYRRQGLARRLVQEYTNLVRDKQSRLVLTCLEEKVGMYESFGFTDLGLSASTWGGEAWHEMEFFENNNMINHLPNIKYSKEYTDILIQEIKETKKSINTGDHPVFDSVDKMIAYLD